MSNVKDGFLGELEVLGFMVRWSFVAFAVIAALTVGFALLQPTVNNLETRGTRQSIQFITTHQTAIRQLYSEYQSPSQDDVHRRAIMAQMRLEADQIPNDVPSDIRAVLGQ